MSRRYRIWSVFTLFLVSYIMVLIVPACLAGYLYHQAMTMSREKYIESEQGRLSRSIAYFERYLEQLDSTVLKLSYDRDLQQILQKRILIPSEILKCSRNETAAMPEKTSFDGGQTSYDG